MEYIDLTEQINPKTQVLTGKTDGVNLRYELDLDSIDRSKQPVTVLFPHTVRAIAPGFFLGLFGHSVLKMGKEKFRQHYLFEDPDTPHLKSSIEAGIVEAWALLAKPEPDIT